MGTFKANGGLAESWLLTDADTLRAAFGRNGYGQMTVLLESPQAFEVLSSALRSIPALNLVLESEAEIRRREGKALNGTVNFLAYFVGLIMAIGAAMGAMNSMYALIDARRRDLVTLRALGFVSSGVAVAVMIEALLLAAPGAIAGVLIPWLLFNGSAANFVGLNFSLAVTSQLAALGVGWAFGHNKAAVAVQSGQQRARRRGRARYSRRWLGDDTLSNAAGEQLAVQWRWRHGYVDGKECQRLADWRHRQ